MMNSPQAQSPPEAASLIFNFLISTRFTDKYAAIDWLKDRSDKIDLPLLRVLILRALRNDYSVKKEETYEDHSIGDTRSWLLSALGRISSDDDEATAEIAKHISIANEPNKWARY